MMRWLRSIAVLLLVSAALLATDWLFKLRTESGTGKRMWRLALIQFIHAPEVEDAEAGFRAALKDSGLIEDADYQLVVRNANGDMSTLPAIIDTALGDGADMLVTFSTPTLQAAMNKTERVPIVFTFVADPVAAGAGRDYTKHRANVTGCYTHHACAEIIDCLRQCLPGVSRVGTLYVPAEVNSVFNRDMLVAAAAKQHIEVTALPLATASDVPDTATALCSRNIDAVIIAGGNLTLAAYPTIAAATRRARLPSFGSVTSQFEAGAAIVVARDYRDAGRQSAEIAARVMRGADPARIPFQPTSKTRLLINLPAARQCGLDVPASLLDRADEVKR
jgi:ABC-type uncharacterized transport system substrate-binding protein